MEMEMDLVVVVNLRRKGGVGRRSKREDRAFALTIWEGLVFGGDSLVDSITLLIL